jgi:hypothetical protein
MDAPRDAVGLLAIAVLASAAPAAAAEPAPAQPRLTVENATVQAVDLAQHTLTVEGDAGAVTVALDRNTLVYLPGGLASVADLRPGTRIRFAREGARASWIEVRDARAEAAPPSPPSQGTGPAGGAPPAIHTAGPKVQPPSVGPGSPTTGTP